MATNEFIVRKGLIVNGSGSTVLDIQGSQGQLFSVTDDLTGTLFSVNDISGIPILSVDSDDTVTMGTFGTNALVVTGSNVGIGLTNPDAILDVSHTAGTTNIIRVSNGAGSYRWRVDQFFNMFMTNASVVDTVGIYNNGDGFFNGNVGIGTTTPA